MSSIRDTFWVEKYRPKNINEYVFHDPHQQAKILELIERQDMPHMLLSGIQGSGKSSLVGVLLHELNVLEPDIKIINASDKNSVDVVREEITEFATCSPMGNFKVIVLEECDFISFNGQAALRRLMEDCCDYVRFILTCNYEYKLQPAIVSRCVLKFRFKNPDKNDIAEFLIKILVSENIKFDLDLLYEYIDFGYPDIRTCVSTIQQYVLDGTLQPLIDKNKVADYKFKLIDLIATDKWVDARKLVCANVLKEEYVDLYRFLYENINTSKKFQNNDLWEEAITIISDYLFKHSVVADPEINLAAMFISLGRLKG